MNKKRLNVGIAGYGIVGKKRREFIDKNPNFHTIAICDKNFSDPKLLDDGIRCFSNYKELLQEPIDVLFVSLPNYLASEVTIAGLSRGLHVFCEKPPGRNIADIERVIKVEKRNNGVLLKYGFNHRYHDSVQDALHIIKQRSLGDIINLRGVYGKSKIIPFSGGWRAERRYAGGGILLDQGIHMVDLMQLFCGEFTEVKSYVSNGYWKHDVEDNAYAIMRDKKGRVAMLHSSATQWEHRFSLEIAFTKGYMELQGILSGSKSYGEEKLVIGRRNEFGTGAAKEEVRVYLEDNSWKKEINEFADAIIRKKIIRFGSSREALAAMNTIYRIYRADNDWKKQFNIK